MGDRDIHRTEQGVQLWGKASVIPLGVDRLWRAWVRCAGVVVSGATQGVEGGLVEHVVWRVEWRSFRSLESGQESHMGWGVEWWSRMDVCRDFMEGSHTDGEVGTEVTQKWEFYAACLELGAGRQVGRSSDRNSCVKSVVCPAAKSSEVT
ncbi:hypothetical protein Pcinc_006852 [Petrolisthes cinctipes]|uniref:Uncharacterized protein n=1 Tax=Petrolisthes cinctipes TaxID=88211 RepID=A0AAE1GAH8_PETCI|nr:hypothetical protein Pcinc_006852 [Petrolisthes cinctipes]